MIRARVPVALPTLLVLGHILVACHRNAPARTNGPVRQDTASVADVKKDTQRVVENIADPAIAALFKDTAATKIFQTEGRTFKLPAQRESLRALIRRERASWQATKPRDYRFLSRVDCFCPGPRGWLLVESRRGRPLRAWDRTGKSAPITDWDTFSIDTFFDNLERTADINGEVQIAFDRRSHFPTYVRTYVLPGPDSWSITEASGLRPI
jgi:hypothetical protein